MTTVEEITNNLNGYPPSELLGKVVFGFENFEEAKAFAVKGDKEYEIHLFERRDGQHFWYDRGQVFEPLTVEDYMKDLGDNYSVTTFEDLKEFLKNDLENLDENEIVDTLEHYKEMFKALAEMEDASQTFIMGSDNYYDVIENVMMSYHHDVTTFQIGVLIPAEDC